MKKTTLFTIIGVVVVGGGIAYYLINKKNNNNKTSDSSSTNNSKGKGLQISVGNGTFPIKIGQHSNLVKELQVQLNRAIAKENLKIPSLDVDGIMGKKTEKALNLLGYNLPLTANDYTKLVTKYK